MALLRNLIRNLRKERVAGCKRDTPDARDRPLGALRLSSSVPTSASVAHPCVVARDQGGTASCVGFAWAQALELAWAQQGVLTGDLSPLAIYFWARSYDRTVGFDCGTYLRSAARAVGKFGVPSEELHPFSFLRVNRSPSWRAYRDGYDRGGVRGYYRITGSAAAKLAGVKQALANGLPVVGGWDIDAAFTDPRGPGLVDRCSGSIIGGHAMAITGYGDDGNLTLLNSWGRSWRERGSVRVTPAFVTAAHDLWAIKVTE